MKVVSTLDELRSVVSDLPSPLGLVPTMGFLHEGHLSLVRKAKAECKSVGASIFVNPTQFGVGEDLEAYPRDLPRDLRLLEEEGVDLVWVPTVDDVYPAGSQTWVAVDELTKQLEGRQRPGHFRGVTTVVAKLFNAFQPSRAYFGQKDAQQAFVIRRMVKDLLLPIEIVVCPIVREEDGLAMSSRNTYLNPEQRRAAIVLHRALKDAAERFQAGERDAEALRGSMLEIIEEEPLALAQYVSVADPDTLEEAQGEVHRALFSMAVYVGETRLIDNVIVGLE
ncbi:MAG TPA: pantoate--beta-alanine ligase [Anaerolineales bacterium]|nr:pantoate--beta-alanine ligase [Anaerolineales bacterium]HUS84785.1 pantoate--beta-alanine ligase [Anaerolineales bacterium]